MKLFRIYEYKGGFVCTKILGLSLIKKDYVLTLLLMGLPIAQKRTYLTQVSGGG